MKGIKSNLELLSQDEIHMIHSSALRILEKIGLSVPNEECLRRCKRVGASIDLDSSKLYIPAKVMEDFIALLRQSAKATGDFIALVHKSEQSTDTVFCSKIKGHISTQIFIVDYRTKLRRLGVSDDVLKGIALVRHLKNIPYSSAVVVPSDVPSKISDLHSYSLIYQFSEKDGGTYIINPETAPYIIDMADVMNRKTSYLLETVSPLKFLPETLKMSLLFADRGQYLGIAPMVMGGSTGPMTIAGTLTLSTAEVLAGLFVVWALTGKPMAFFNGSSHTTDPRTMLCSFGSPNQALIGIGVAQIANYYGIPSGSNSALSDSLAPDFQCGFEKSLSGLLSILAGSSSFGCQGIAGADQGFSFEQLVIDNEWIDACNYVFDGAEINEETIAVEIIEQVGIGGNFLSEEHTVKHIKDSWWGSRLFARNSFDIFLNDKRNELLDKAELIVEEYTADYKNQQLVIGEDKAAEIKRIYEKGIKMILG